MSLELASVRLVRGDFNLDVTISLARGTTGVILGPSGCGKTTLLRIVAGLDRMDSGRISIDEARLDLEPPENRGIGFVFQDLALFAHMTGRGNIAYSPRLRNIPRPEIEGKVENLAASLRILPLLDRRPASMSGGERQRLAFARALASDPRLMLLDEPLSSLDPGLRRELRGYLREELSKRGITALHVTHDVEEALELADTIFVMRAGRIVASGSPEAIFRKPPDAWTAAFLSTGPLFPARVLESGGGAISLLTPFGPCAVPTSAWRGVGVDAFPGPGVSAFLHFSMNAVRNLRFTGGGALLDAGASPATGLLHLTARMERLVFEGERYRLVCTAPRSTEWEGRTLIELAIPSDPLPAGFPFSGCKPESERGEDVSMSFEVSADACSLLTGDAADVD